MVRLHMCTYMFIVVHVYVQYIFIRSGACVHTVHTYMFVVVRVYIQYIRICS